MSDNRKPIGVGLLAALWLGPLAGIAFAAATKRNEAEKAEQERRNAGPRAGAHHRGAQSDDWDPCREGGFAGYRDVQAWREATFRRR